MLVIPVWTAGASSFKCELQSPQLISRNPVLMLLFVGLPRRNCVPLAQAHLGQDSLAGQEFGGHADDKPKHGQAAIPEFGKGNEAETGSGVIHGIGSNGTGLDWVWIVPHPGLLVALL